jgi:hypothetical protein
MGSDDLRLAGGERPEREGIDCSGLQSEDGTRADRQLATRAHRGRLHAPRLADRKPRVVSGRSWKRLQTAVLFHFVVKVERNTPRFVTMATRKMHVQVFRPLVRLDENNEGAVRSRGERLS